MFRTKANFELYYTSLYVTKPLVLWSRDAALRPSCSIHLSVAFPSLNIQALLLLPQCSPFRRVTLYTYNKNNIYLLSFIKVILLLFILLLRLLLNISSLVSLLITFSNTLASGGRTLMPL